METKNNLGIWMDHSTAHLININSKNESRSIVSKFTSETKEEALSKSEILEKTDPDLQPQRYW